MTRVCSISPISYLENQIREVFGLTGTPVRMVIASAAISRSKEGNMTLTHLRSLPCARICSARSALRSLSAR
ncbi:MAG: hypothetical protein ACLUI3_14820 [Christensenellales bacterium]